MRLDVKMSQFDVTLCMHCKAEVTVGNTIFVQGEGRVCRDQDCTESGN